MLGLIFGIGGFIKSVVGSVLGFMFKHPLLFAVIALAGFSGWCWLGWSAAQAETGKLIVLRQADAKKLAASNKSVADLTKEMSNVFAANKRLADADAARIKAGRDALAKVEAESRSKQGKIDRLLASGATARPLNKCEPSEAIKDIWQ